MRMVAPPEVFYEICSGEGSDLKDCLWFIDAKDNCNIILAIYAAQWPRIFDATACNPCTA
jgi:hypothetical protein